jgi:hypothetical protein
MTIRPTLPPERDFPAERLELRKRQLMLQVEAEQRRRPARPPARRRVRRAALGAAAALTAAAIAVTALLPAGGGGPSPAAAAVLRHAARAAARQPVVEPPRPGQFVYTKSESLFMDTAVTQQQTIDYYEHVTREAWIGPDGSGRIREAESTPGFVTDADRAAWVAAGKPDLTGGRNSDHTWGAGGLDYLNLGKLPTAPSQLKQLIEDRTIEGGPPGDAETFTIIGDLLRETYAPPGVRSALYTIASQLPGVQLVGRTRDQLGRPGIAVAYVSHAVSHELIFDPDTSALLAERQQVVGTDSSQVQPRVPVGTVLESTAYVNSGVVDSTSSTVSAGP